MEISSLAINLWLNILAIEGYMIYIHYLVISYEYNARNQNLLGR